MISVACQDSNGLILARDILRRAGGIEIRDIQTSHSGLVEDRLAQTL